MNFFVQKNTTYRNRPFKQNNIKLNNPLTKRQGDTQEEIEQNIADNCNLNAMRVLDEEGPQAIFNKIDVHHLYGYKAVSTLCSIVRIIGIEPI